MLNEIEQQFLQKTLTQQQQQLQYYIVLAIILLLLSWGLFFAIKRNGILIVSILMSVGIWYYPWRYYQKIQGIKKDLENEQKIKVTTSIYSKNISRINRIQPYYYIYTNDDCFEVNKAIYNSLEEHQTVLISYAPVSKTILDIQLLTE